MTVAVSFRATSRLILLDEDERVLLFEQFGTSHDVPPRWITPGGGVDRGESHAAAGVRELEEETGLRIAGLPLAFHVEEFDADRRWHAYERGRWAWYAIRVPHFSPSAEGWTKEEQTDVVRYRWWPLDELEGTQDDVEPGDLVERIRSRLARGVPRASLL